MNCVYLILALLASPAIAPDYTNPRKTMETFIEALEADDRPAMKNCIVSPRDQFNALDVVIEEATADRRLWLACQKLTPDIRAAIHVEMLAHYCSDDSLATSRKLIKEATVDVTDKMAVLNFKPREGNESLIAVMSEAGALHFRRVGDDWKINGDLLPAVLELIRDHDPTAEELSLLDAQHEDTMKQIKAVREGARHISNGDWKTVKEIEAGMDVINRAATKASH